MKRQGYRKFILGCVLFMLSACTDDIENEYANLRAFFRYPLVATTAPLRTALENPGHFCTIRYDARHYYFTGADGTSATQPRTALDAYGAPISVAGFIVGTPDLPDLHTGIHQTIAYDLVCPSCYSENAIERSLTFKKDHPAHNTMVCSRCQRIYDLNNQGIPVAGPPNSRKLYRYRLTYSTSTGTLIIQN